MTRMCVSFVFLFFFNDTATTEIYTLSLHDALPIFSHSLRCSLGFKLVAGGVGVGEGVHAAHDLADLLGDAGLRSEEHTSELQSRQYLVCRLLLEKKNESSLALRHLLTHRLCVLSTS